MKNKALTKILSAILSVVIVICAAPLNGFVGLKFPEFKLPDWSALFDFSIKSEAAAYSGSCGTNVTWSLDTETGVLEITGTGAMDNYSSYAPWYSYRSYVKTVNIAYGVTSICDHAFRFCYSLTSVTIGNSVVSIGDGAFLSCYSLASITIPDSVTSIGDDAFWNCDSLTSITIPNSVTSIGDSAFEYCDNLELVTIGNSVTSIGDSAFSSCDSLTSINVDSGNENYSSDSYGVLYDKNKTTLIHYPISNSRTTFTIPDSVTSIGNYAFKYCDSLTAVTIGDSVTSIGDSAFEYCDNLELVTIGNSVTSIGDSAFECCYSLTSVTIPDSVTSIGDDAFWNCDSLTSITIPNSVTSIGDSAFEYCDNLELVTIGNSVTSIGDSAFSSCDSLTSINVDSGNENYSSDSYGVLYDKNKTTLIQYPVSNSRTTFTIPDSVISICSGAFDSCKNLTSIMIPDSVTSIGDSAFEYCYSLTSVTIGNNVTSIGDGAFEICYSLTSITIPNSVTSIGDSAFEYCYSLTSITIPNSVTSIGDSAFEYCYSLTSVTIPDSVTSIGDSAFSSCDSLTSINVDSGNENYSSDSYGALYDKNKTTLIQYPVSNSRTTFTIPDSVISICSGAFENCYSLTSVTIPDSVTSIGDSAFENCDSLASVTIGNSVTSIENNTFAKCTSLKEIIIPESVTSISETAFSDTDTVLVLPKEDSQLPIELINNEMLIKLNETGIKDAEDRYLNRGKTGYYSNSESISSSGILKFTVKYDFKDDVKNSVSNMKLKIYIPSTATVVENALKVNGVTTTYSLSGRILTVDLTEKAGTVIFALKPESADFLSTYALIDYSLDGTTKTETIGIINLETSVLTINIPEETSKSTINVSGVASPSETITFYVNEENMGTCVASKIGTYSKSVELKDTVDGKLYTIEARVKKIDGTTKIATAFITYNYETVKMTSCKMYYSGIEYDMMDNSGKRPVVTWNGGSFTFKVTFENSAIIDQLYIVSTKGNEIKKIPAVYDEENDVFVATGFNGYLPGSISVDYLGATNEYIVDTDESIDFEAIFDVLPEEFKEADVEVQKNTFAEDDVIGLLGPGCFEATIDLKDDNKTSISYRYERNEVKDSSITEQSLKEDGYTKVKKDDGSYSYVKMNKDSQNNINVSFYDFSAVTFGTVYKGRLDFLLDSLDPGGSLNTITAVGETFDTFAEIGADKIEVSQVVEKINQLDISDAEKQARLKAFDEFINKKNELKAVQVCGSIASMALGLVPGVGTAASLAIGAIINMYFGIVDDIADDSFDAFVESLLDVNFRFAVDPSGFVYEAVTGNRLSGVKTTAYYKDSSTGNAVLWNAEEYDQMNPLYTDQYGKYAWDVPEGLWQVKFEKEGYETTYSEWLPVPPPQVDVNINMNSLSTPEVEYINVYQDSIEISFTQYMNISSINSTNVVFTSGGEVLEGNFEALDADYDNSGTKQYAKTFSFTPYKDMTEDVTVEISNVENYCAKKIAETYSEAHEVVFKINSIVAPETETAEYDTTTSIIVQASPAKAAAGKTVNVTISDSYIVQAESLTLIFDENGQAELKLTTLLPGTVDISFAIADTTLSATTKLSVVATEPVRVDSIILDKVSLSLSKGRTYQLGATAYPTDAVNKTILWSSADEEIATVDSNGNITALKEGQTEIIATSANGKVVETCKVFVVNGVTINGAVSSKDISDNDEITIEVISPDTNEVIYQTTISDSDYKIDNVLSGEYIVRASKENHTTREYNITVESEDIELDIQINPIGDVNGDGKILLSDYTAVLRHVKKTSVLEGYAFKCADVTGDGKITLLDYTKLLRHVKKTELIW